MNRLNHATALASLALPLVLLSASARAEEWNQWRGPHRNGLDTTSPKLIDALPEQRLKPLLVRLLKLSNALFQIRNLLH